MNSNNDSLVSQTGTAQQSGLPAQSGRLFSAVIISIVGILFLMTFFQAIEIGRLRGYVQAQEPVAASAAAKTSQPANPAPAANAGLPSQVGGC